LFWAIGCFAVNIADKDRQAGMPQLLTEGYVLAKVVPVVLDHPLKQISVRIRNGLALPDHILFQHFLERGRAGGSTVGKVFVNLRQQHLPLSLIQETSLLLPGQVPDIPTDTVHWQNAFTRFGFLDVFDGAQEFTTRKA
jgi:hypothetical protein